MPGEAEYWSETFQPGFELITLSFLQCLYCDIFLLCPPWQECCGRVEIILDKCLKDLPMLSVLPDKVRRSSLKFLIENLAIIQSFTGFFIRSEPMSMTSFVNHCEWQVFLVTCDVFSINHAPHVIPLSFSGALWLFIAIWFLLCSRFCCHPSSC